MCAMAEHNATTGVPLLGFPGSTFYTLHIIAITSCFISTVSSIAVLLFLFWSERTTSKRRFYKWTKGERLVVYLAMFDLTFSSTHIVDHSYILAAEAFPPDPWCRIFAFFVLHGITGQWLVVFFSSLSAFITVVLEKPVKLGRYDWRLLTIANGIPIFFNSMGLLFKYLGPSGGWCLFTTDILGLIMLNVSAALLLVIFLTCGFFYVAIWIKVKAIGRDIINQSTERKQKMNRSGRVMMVFVLAFMVQWWAWLVHAVWGFFTEPSIWVALTGVFLCNLGGLINAFAYTVIRRKYLKHKQKEVKAKHKHLEATTCTSSAPYD